jgi:uncharacterized protein YutE (UPF0331/DUF86 family)
MTIDRDLVTRKLLLIVRDLDALTTVGGRGVAAYEQNRIDQAVAERHLERMIGRMIDVNYHLLIESGQPPPSDYYASFVQLGTIGVLEPAFAQRVAASAGLRNRIVHEYDEIDHRRVFEALTTALVDIPRYVASVETYLQRLDAGGDAGA